MNSPAIRQNADSWSSLFAAHLDAVVRRSTDALAQTGYDALLVHAGTPPLIFLDDHAASGIARVLSPSTDKNCTCFKWIGESIKSRAAM